MAFVFALCMHSFLKVVDSRVSFRPSQLPETLVGLDERRHPEIDSYAGVLKRFGIDGFPELASFEHF